MNDKTDRKEPFIEALKKSLGVIESACRAVGITRATYYNWRNNDPEFAAACDEVQEVQWDFVQTKFNHLVQEGNAAAIMYYLKTKGVKRGWNERYNLAQALRENANQEEIQALFADCNQQQLKEIIGMLRNAIGDGDTGDPRTGE